MPMSEKQIKRFLSIQSHERFAKLLIEESKTKTAIFSKKDMYIYNTEFKYYEPVDIGGRFLNLVSRVLHEAIEPWEQHFAKKLALAIADKELDKEDKDEIKTHIKQIQNKSTTLFIPSRPLLSLKTL